MEKLIYFDNCATTPLCPEALEGIERAARSFGNPSSLHLAGREASQLEEECRKEILKALGARSEEYEVLFTSGGTEGNNLAILGCAHAKKRRTPLIVTTDSEHPSVLEPFKRLQGEGFEVVKLKTAGGKIDPEEFDAALKRGPFLVSIMSVNNETGAVYGVFDLFRRAKELCPSVLCHTDAVQAFGKIPTPLHRSDVDLMTLSAHKIHGPKGCGALVVRRELLTRKELTPLLLGGGQELGLRSGTQNTVGIAGFTGALRSTFGSFEENASRVTALRARLKSGLSPEIRVNEPPVFSPYILSVTLPQIKSETALNALSARGICVSAGSACASNGRHKSYVLSAYGLSDKQVDATLRIGFAAENTEEETDLLARALDEAVLTLVRFR